MDQMGYEIEKFTGKLTSMQFISMAGIPRSNLNQEFRGHNDKNKEIVVGWHGGIGWHDTWNGAPELDNGFLLVNISKDKTNYKVFIVNRENDDTFEGELELAINQALDYIKQQFGEAEIV
jgi:hypothetical protein